MTNTLNTPVEAIEAAYPLLVRRYGLRRRSGGGGRHPGGEGVLRELEALAPMQVTLLTERRRLRPYGLRGGKAGQPGRNTLYRRNAEAAGERLPAKVSLPIEAGDRIRIETPGGGGWGRKRKRRRG